MTTTTDARLEILKQDRKGRVRTPKAKREAILDEYERSGMSGAGFAEYLGMKYQTFAGWVQQRGKQKGLAEGKAAVRWVEAEAETGKAGLVVEVAGGARMRVGDEREAKLAAAVLRHLGAGRC